MGNKIQFAYNEDGSIDWDNTYIPRIDFNEDEIAYINQKPEDV